MQDISTQQQAPSVTKISIYAGLLSLYLIWGSTYLGIRFAIDTIPTFMMAGSRNLIAGILLYGWSKIYLKTPTPTRQEWIVCIISGLLLLFVGNGGITLVEHWIPSGFIALVVACVPVWIVLLQWLIFKEKPTLLIFLGVALGILGVGLLVMNKLTLKGSEDLFYWGVGITLFTTICWSSGVVFMKSKNLALSAAQIAGMQQISGGTALMILSASRGEMADFTFSQISYNSWLAYGFLVIFGSIVGFSVFGWLSKAANPALVSTYAFVNPLVAVILGRIFLTEPLPEGIIIPAILIIIAVVVITRGKR